MPPKKYSFQPIFFTTIGQPQQQLTKQEFKNMLERWSQSEDILEYHPAMEVGLDNPYPYISMKSNAKTQPFNLRQNGKRRVAGPGCVYGVRDGNWKGDFEKNFINPLFNILKMGE